MDIVNGRTDKRTTICSTFGEHRKDVQCTLTYADSAANAPSHMLAQAAVVAAFKLLDH